MKHYFMKCNLETEEQTKFYDITDFIIETLNKSDVKNGHLLLQPLHTTVGIYMNEYEDFLVSDFADFLVEHVPDLKGKYKHDDIPNRDCPPDEPENGHSHIKSAFYSNPSLSLVIFNGELQIGKYQRILFAEFDGPCPRKHKSKRAYLISIIGE